MELRAGKKGFTLVEVLIVVIILGILAALVIPRIVSQPQSARTAEAMQMLGSLRKAQLDRLDLMGTPAGNFIQFSDNIDPRPWNQLGLLAPGATVFGGVTSESVGQAGFSAGPIYFDYACFSGPNNCTATLSGNPSGGSDDMITLLDNGTFFCDGGFEQPESGGVPVNSCVYTGNDR